MTKTFLSLLLVFPILLSLAACSTPVSQGSDAAISEITAPPSQSSLPETRPLDGLEQFRTGTPWICSTMQGVVTADSPCSAKDDFALYVNKDYYLSAQIPTGYISTGTIFDIKQENDLRITEMFQTGTFDGKEAQAAKAFYDLQMDWDSRNRLGTDPFTEKAALIDNIQTIEELQDYILHTPVATQLSLPFIADLTIDSFLNNQYIPTILNPSLILSDAGEYEKPTKESRRILNLTQNYTQSLLQHMGYPSNEAAEKVNNSLLYESMLAKSYFTLSEMNAQNYFQQINNHFSRDEILEMQGNIPAVELVEDVIGCGYQEVWVIYNVAWLNAMKNLFSTEHIALLKDWIICTSARAYAHLLDRPCYDLEQQYQEKLTGTAPLSDEIRAAENTLTLLPWQTNQIYTATYFTQQDKDRLSKIIQEMILSYKQMLQEETFISDETKNSAMQKLDNMVINCLYPNDWEPYRNPYLEIKSADEGGTLVEAFEAVKAAQARMDLDTIQTPYDRTLWSNMTLPSTVNAAYLPRDNSVSIMAAICQGDVYHPDMSEEEVLGKIGFIIAHELTHAFDINGSQFGIEGGYANWWTDQDRAAFNRLDSRIAASLSSVTLWNGNPIPGELKTAETCADMGAMKCCLMIASQIPGFDYDQFFRSYADLWKALRSEYSMTANQTDAHLAEHLRINIVLQQFDEFLDFYDIKPGDGMYLAPADRILIW